MNASWLEVSLVVDGELAEAVAEVLARFADNGVVIESTAVTADPDDSEGHAVGPLRVCGYLPVNAQLEETRQKLEQALWYLGRIRPLPQADFRLVQEQDWSEVWKQHYRPISIGQRLIIVPAWLDSPNPERTAIRMDPGMAFGTGTHPTTQLCLELIEAVYNQPTPTEIASTPRKDVIDVGCGSGILSVAALMLGADHALGVDIDAEAVTASEENALLNGVAGRFEIGLGSVAEIHAGQFSIRSAPLVVANILAPVIIRLLDDGLGDLLVDKGRLVLSGILEEQADEVISALDKHGLDLVDRRQIADWVALAAARR